jgi:glycerol-3-phosphate dehydrogenase
VASTDCMYDVVIIGAGVAGAAVARELSRYRLSAAIVEKEAEVCFGATKGSHAFIHCGMPAPGSPLKSRGEREGNRMLPQICRELDVPFRQIGKLLVAFNAAEIDALRDLEKKISAHGVPGVELIFDREVIHRMEPHLSEKVVGALHTPTTGVTSPWGLVFGLVENAVANGVRLYTHAPVASMKAVEGGRIALCAGQRTLFARYVINAAGPDAARVAEMVGDRSISLEFLKMQRVIMDRECGGLVGHLIRGLDQGDPVGDFIAPTVDGNIMVGSTVELVKNAEDVATTADGFNDWVFPAGRKLLPGLSLDKAIRPFSGTMPLAGDDYHIRPAENFPQLVNFVLGASGLTAAVPMAKIVVNDILPELGLTLEEKADYCPNRDDIPRFHDLDHEARAGLIAQHPDYGSVVCRCESVTEGEIVEAMTRGACTRDGIKFRTRAGMGRCQGNFCGHKLLGIMSRELARPADTLTRRGNDSFELRPRKEDRTTDGFEDDLSGGN